MPQAVFLSIAAGLASALLSGVLSPGSVLAALLFFVAPLPLLIVGLGWHPLIAALGALIGCILMSMGIGSKAALYYGAMVGLPAYLLAALMPRLMQTPLAGDMEVAGRRIGAVLLGGIGAYAVAVTLVGALSIDTDHASFTRRLAATVETMFRGMFEGTTMPLPPGANLSDMAKLYAYIMPPMLTFLVAIALTLSLWLAVRIVQKSERLPFAPLPAYALSLPKEALFIFVGGMGLTQLGGYPGFVGKLVMVAAAFCLMLAGLSLLHYKTVGRNGRTIMLTGAWALLLITGLPAFIFAFAGALDAALDLRRRTGGVPPFNS